jgi:hypothetical protein
MTLNTDWRNVKNNEASKLLGEGQNDFNLGILLCVLEVPVIHKDTIEELEFRHNFYKLVSGSKSEINFKMFIGYSCNSGYKTRGAWIKRIVKANSTPSIAAKRVWECYSEVRKDN